MSLILSTDTSTKACTVSLAVNGEVIAQRAIHEEGFSHAEQLHVLMQATMSEAGQDWKDLDAVAIGKGPGSFTGLRIGVSAAKGLCYAMDIPLISLPTLQVMCAHALQLERLPTNAILRPMLDARRMEVYTAAYSRDLSEVSPCEAKVIEEGAFKEELGKGPVYFFGDGMEKCRQLLEVSANSHFIKDIIPGAESMARLAQKAFDSKKFEDVAYFEPFYLKDFIAKPPKKMV
jgi:tRNA threonylcarbamoyladenosine biosynthesis protein TsaB